jgi:lysophospholipase L1-like esterase
MQLEGVRTVVFAGDSVTDCGHTGDPPRHLGHGYVRLVDDALATMLGPSAPRVVNCGTGGNRLVDLERRWQTDVIARQPDVVSVLIGVNDTWRRYDRGMLSLTTEFEARYDRMLGALVDATHARLVLVEPFLVPVDDDQPAWRADLDPKIDAVHRLAEKWSATLVPADREMHERARVVGAAALADDGVHPTDLGHKVLADLWLDTVLG